MLNHDDLLFENFPQGVSNSKGIRITHTPTGLAIICRDEDTYILNREKALKKLEMLVNNFVK